MKRLLSVFMCVAILLSFSINTFAKESDNSKTKPSEIFHQFCQEYFKSPDDYKVIDKEGNDINETFLTDNLASFNESNIDSIWDYTKKNVSKFSKVLVNNEDPSVISPYATVKKDVSEWFYEVETSGVKVPDFEFQYTISGSYTYDIAKGTILSYVGPYLSIDYCSLGGVWDYEPTNVSTRGTISSDKYKITFSASFKMIVELTVPIGDIGIPGYTETLGGYYNSFDAYPD